MIWPEQTQGKADVPIENAFVDMVKGIIELIFRCIWQILKHPMIWVPPALVGGFVYLVGPIAAGMIVLLVAFALTQWEHLSPESFDRILWHRLRTRAIRTFRYELGWKHKMVDCGLHKVVKGRPDRYPRIRGFETNVYRDRVLVEMVDGQKLKTYQDAAGETLPGAFKALQVRVVKDKERANHIWMIFKKMDLLSQEISAFAIEEDVDLTALPVGYDDDGELWTMPATHKQGAHLLAAATTGGGKSSLIQCMIRAMAAKIRDGYVELWICDPKGGLEFDRLRKMCKRYVEDDYIETLNFLKAAVKEMDERSHRQKANGGSRNHVATVEEPLIFIVIDEILSITAFETTARRTAIQSLIAKLLTKGRAVGVTVVVCSQDATKAYLQIRQFFPCRWAGRLTDMRQPDMVLGDGAREMGARCDDDDVIPYSLPGVGFVTRDGVREPVRTRTAHVTEDDIDWMVLNYSPPESTDDKVNKTLASNHKKKVLSAEFRRTDRLDHEVESWKKFFEQQVEDSTNGSDSVEEDREVIETS